MSEANQDLVRHLLSRADAGDVSVVSEVVAHDYLDHNPPPFQGSATGSAGARDAFTAVLGIFSDFSPDVVQQFSDGDYVISRIVGRGRHTGKFLGIPATGKDVTIEGIAIHRVVDGTWSNTGPRWTASGCSSRWERFRHSAADAQLDDVGAPWHFLNLRPDPHGHGAFRDALAKPAPAGSGPLPRERVTPASPSTVGALYSRAAGRRGWPSASLRMSETLRPCSAGAASPGETPSGGGGPGGAGGAEARGSAVDGGPDRAPPFGSPGAGAGDPPSSTGGAPAAAATAASLSPSGVVSSAGGSSWTSTLNRKPTDSSLIASIMAPNIVNASRWYSTSGSRWP